MNTNVADAMQISKNLSLETRKSPAQSVTPETLRRNFRYFALRALKDPLPVLPAPGQAARPVVRPPAVPAGKKSLSRLQF